TSLLEQPLSLRAGLVEEDPPCLCGRLLVAGPLMRLRRVSAGRTTVGADGDSIDVAHVLERGGAAGAAEHHDPLVPIDDDLTASSLVLVGEHTDDTVETLDGRRDLVGPLFVAARAGHL